MTTSSLEAKWVARFVLALSAELIYLAGRTWLLRHWPAGVAQELAWNAWRLPFIAIYLALFRSLIFAAPARPMPRHPLLLAAIALACVGIPIDPPSHDWNYRLVLAFTSPIVGVREELFYRGIVQGFLERAIGPLPALLVACAVFVAFHYGAQPFTASSVAWIFAVGFVLGVIYQRTQSIWLVAALHAAVDFVSPLVPQLPVPPGIAMAADGAAIGLALAWWRADRGARK
jgi:membrane protease YdiL (CAAX protease family)